MSYKNILIKLSGEAIADENNIISQNVLNDIYTQVKILVEKYQAKISIVVGGGNIIRGSVSESLGLGKDTYDVDYMGILATTINALALNAYFNNRGLKSAILNSLNIEEICEKTNAKKAKKLLSEGKVLIFGGGTGKPYVSTDTAAALRAVEVEADVILMAKNGVDGAYSEDPKLNQEANFFEELELSEIISKKLAIIDHEMIPILKNKKIDLILFNMKVKNNIINLYEGKNIKKTIVRNK